MQLQTLLTCCAATVFILGAVPRAQAQVRVELTGRVLDAGTEAPVTGAEVQLLGIGRAVTGDDGAFRFPRLEPGWRTLRITTLDHAPYELDLLLHRDTTVTVRLERRPIPLDPVVARAEAYTVRGRVVAQGTGRRIVDAEVFAGASPVRTGVGGRFTLPPVAAGAEVRISVEALGYEPAGRALTVGGDTTIIIEMEPDPVGQQIIAAQTRRLDDRARLTGYTAEQIDANQLVGRGHVTALDAVRSRLGTRITRVQCVLLDDRVRSLEELSGYSTDIIHRIELLDRGRMVRVYTTSFLQQMVEGRMTLRPIVLFSRGGACM